MKEIRFKDVGNHDLQPISYYIKKFTPDFYMGMHSHSYFEIMYASKGNFNMEILKNGNEESPKNIETIIVHQGELIFLDAALFHRLQISEGEAVIYNLELQPESSQYSPPPRNILPINYGVLIENTSLKALTTSKTGYTIVPDLSDIDSVFRGVISSLLKNDMNTEDWLCVRLNISLLFMEIAKSVRLLEQNNVHYIKKIWLYIKHHFSQKITLDDISREIGYHKTYSASQFKKYTGKTIVQTINSMRISKSLRLLRDTSHSISEIGKMAGFPSYAQMVHEFNVSFGMSPSACRKMFLDDEVDHDNPKYQSIAVRVNDEDMRLDNQEFNNSFYKKNIQSKMKDLINY